MMFEDLMFFYIKAFHLLGIVIIIEALEGNELKYHLNYRSADTQSCLLILGWI